MPTLGEQIRACADLLRSARSVCCLTGAGISAESGVPTFRGSTGGFWQDSSPEELATVAGFKANPAKVWQFYNWRRNQLLTVQPNPGHFALADVQRRLRDFTLITQNVDRLHQKAGSRNVIELHGDIWTIRCTACGDQVDATGQVLPNDPRCHRCGALMRPGVVWFGEMLPFDALRQAERATEACDVMLVVGTSSTVYPAAAFSFQAKASGAWVGEINLEPTDLSTVADLSIQDKAGVVLPMIVDQLGA